MNPPSLSLTNVTKSFGQTEIIRGVSMNVGAGERHALIGPNGAGKTTLFNCLTGFYKPTSGHLRLYRDNQPRELAGLPAHKTARLGIARLTHALFSWPAAPVTRSRLRSPFALLAIDHIYAGADWKPVNVARGARLGSDHYPIVAILTR